MIVVISRCCQPKHLSFTLSMKYCRRTVRSISFGVAQSANNAKSQTNMYMHNSADAINKAKMKWRKKNRPKNSVSRRGRRRRGKTHEFCCYSTNFYFGRMLVTSLPSLLLLLLHLVVSIIFNVGFYVNTPKKAVTEQICGNFNGTHTIKLKSSTATTPRKKSTRKSPIQQLDGNCTECTQNCQIDSIQLIHCSRKKETQLNSVL